MRRGYAVLSILASCLSMLAGCGGDLAPEDGGRDALAVCSADLDCADGLFCNGAEECAPGSSGADERGCAPAATACLATQTCDETADRCLSDCDERPDADGDGRDATECGGDDCDDGDADRYPGNAEVCDAAGHDEDCNLATLGPDGDSDGFVSTTCCNTQLDGTLDCGSDCNDANGEVNPEATEVCNGVDEDCDGALDGPDEDDDGDGAPDACAGLPAGETDCDDEDATVHPGAEELCDGLDNDCDGSPLAGDDLDGDGYAAVGSACVEAAATLPKTDCDDASDAAHPGASDGCNGADDDCNGTLDDATSADASCNPAARGAAVCEEGACAIASCETGYDDCDAMAGNGCEVTLAADPDHCGACGDACDAGSFCRASDCRPSHALSLRFGGTGDDGVTALAVDGSGNLYITGRITGTVSFGGPSLDGSDGSIFVASFTPAGAHRWSGAYGGGPLSSGEDLAVDSSGNVYVTGKLAGTANFGGGARTSAGDDDVFVASFAPGGAHRWSQRYGSTGADTGLGIAIVGTSVVVTGGFSETVDFGGPFARTSNGGYDVFVLGLTTAGGAHAWSAGFGGTGLDMGEAVAGDSAGNTYMTGRINGQVALYQFTPTGGLGWSDRYGTSGGNATGADLIAQGASLFVVGSFQTSIDLGGGVDSGFGGYDAFIASYAIADGAHRWSAVYGGTSVDRAFGVAVAAGEPLMAGMFGGAVDFGGGALASAGGLDAFVAGYGATGGAHAWSRRDGASGNDPAAEVAVSGSAIWVAGNFQGTVDFGGGTRTSAGGSDIFLLQLAL